MKDHGAPLTAAEQKLAQTSSNEVFFPKGNEYNSWKDDVSKYIN